MKKFEIRIDTLVLIIVAAFALVVVISTGSQNIEDSEGVYPLNDTTTATIIDAELNYAHNFKEYEKHIWDCSNMSEMLIHRLEKWGIESYYCYGSMGNSQNVKHAWVEIYKNATVIVLDPAAGHIIRWEIYDKNYNKIWCKRLKNEK